MPKSSLKFRVGVLVVLLVTAVAGLAAARWAALPWALDKALRAGGATEVSFDVAKVSPWLVEVDDLAFKLDAVRFAAGRTSFARAHWWSPSLGHISVQTARVDIDVDKWAARKADPAVASAAPTSLPLEGISFDGQVTVRAGDELQQALVVRFDARPEATGDWRGEATVSAPGLDLAVAGSYAPVTAQADFQTTVLRVDLQPWQAWLEHWMPLPFGPWELAGQVSGTVKGGFRGTKLEAAGELKLREARVANPGLGFVAEGVEADVGAADFALAQARDIAVRARRITTGKIVLTELQAGLASATAGRVEVTSLSTRAMGGMMEVEPFVYRADDPAIEAVVRAEAIRAEEVLALTQDLPARATGPLSGRLPLRYEAGSLRLGTGWLGLTAGDSLEVELHAKGLLTAGTSPQSANYAVLKQVEDGLLKLKVTELRLDVRPPNAPGNRTAQLRIVGAPVDPKVKAPVTLDLNVNGPIESLLNLGLKGGVSVGTKP